MGLLQPLRVLVVEDHKDYQQLLVAALTAAGHEVMAANSRRSALDIAGTTPFDVVLCDYRLSDGSGVDLMKELKSAHGLRGICLSGYEEDDVVGVDRESGFEKFLVKGVPFETIFAAIEGVASSRA